MKKLNNSGFSLIELIIVMAIMAILTIAVAPQYLKYVERSRKSVDVQTMATVVSAIQIYAADPMADSAASDTQAIKVGDTTPVSGMTGYVGKALTNAGISDVVIKSKEWTNSSADLSIVVTVTDGVPKIDVTGEKDGLDIVKGITEKPATTSPAPTATTEP